MSGNSHQRRCNKRRGERYLNESFGGPEGVKAALGKAMTAGYPSHPPGELPIEDLAATGRWLDPPTDDELRLWPKEKA